MFKQTEGGFKLMNEALKKSVEGRSATDHRPGDSEARVIGE